ncbi:MAG: FAD-binding oxidoreductase [Desulfobacterota bacterium]|nr:FAD-binding oxidoreductase [Thermodesulfobacteriota bacterium]
MTEKVLAKVDYLKPLPDMPYDVVMAGRREYHERVRTSLADIVGNDRITDDQQVLERYSHDKSFEPAGRPSFVVYPENVEQICRIVKKANELLLPVVPASSGTHCYGAAIPRMGGVVIDLSAWKTIYKIDHRNRATRIQPGVTYDELQRALESHGLRALFPLLPRKDQSVVTSHLEAQPKLIPEFNYSEPIYTAEIVLPSGDLFRTGTAAVAPPEANKTDLIGPWGPGFDWNRLYTRAQGTLGIVTWLNIMAEPLPTREKLFFTPCNSIDQAAHFTYRLGKKWIGYECFTLNRAALAMMLAEHGPDEYRTIKENAPAYLQIFCIAGLKRFPDERIAYQEADFFETARECNVSPSVQVPHIPRAASFFATHLRQCWDRDVYWKDMYKGASAEIFFITTMDRAAAHIAALQQEAIRFGYDPSDIGVYLQPIENGRAAHLEFIIPYDPGNAYEVRRVKDLWINASEAMYRLGAVFTRAYGYWADMVNRCNAVQYATARQIKEILDPNNIMNPGKLGL